jgi:TonB family protein
MNVLKKAVCLGMLILGLAAVSRPVGAQQQLDELRQATKKVSPVYPPLAQKAGLSGTVKMVLVVTPEGNVKAVRTVGGNAVLVPAAEAAAKQWKFEVSKVESSVLVALRFGTTE